MPNIINGTASADTILGTSGDDLIAAGAGNDIIYASRGKDSVDGGLGTDTLLIETGRLGLDKSASGSLISLTLSDNRVVDDSGVLDTSFSNIENITI